MRNDVPTVKAVPGSNAVEGRVVWSPLKSSTWFGMAAGGVAALVMLPSWGGALLFAASSAVTLCLGHSLGMHRRLIHRSYRCPLWMERRTKG